MEKKQSIQIFFLFLLSFNFCLIKSSTIVISFISKTPYKHVIFLTLSILFWYILDDFFFFISKITFFLESLPLNHRVLKIYHVLKYVPCNPFYATHLLYRVPCDRSVPLPLRCALGPYKLYAVDHNTWNG